MFAYRRLGAAVCGLTLAALLLAVPARAAEVDKLLPNDTETLVTINVKQILDSPLVQKLAVDKLKKALDDQDEAKKVLTELGFDPFKDLESITIALSSGSDTDKNLIIAHGKFDVAKITAKGEEVAKDMKDVVKITKVPGPGAGAEAGKINLYEVNVPGQAQSLFITILDKNTILASAGKDYVLDAIDKAAKRKKSELKSKELQTLLGRIDGKQSIWTAVLGSTLEKSPLAQDDTAKDLIAKLVDAHLGLTVDKDLKAEVSITAKNTEDAKKLDDAITDNLNQAVGILSLLAGNQPEIKPLLNVLKTIRPSIKDKTISIQATLAGDDIEKAIEKLKP
jgi:hypothetical protein